MTMLRYGVLGLVVLLLWGASAEGAITEVGSMRATRAPGGTHDSETLAFPNNVTSGQLLVVMGMVGGSPSAVAVTDTLSTSYTVKSAAVITTKRIFIAYGFASSSGANTVTVDPNGSVSFITFFIDAFTGVDASIPLDVDDGATSGGPNTTPTASITTGVANALILGMMGDNGGTHTITENGSYTLIGEHDGSLSEAGSGVFRVVTTATSYTVDWTESVSVNWAIYLISLKPTTVAGSVNHGRMRKGFGS